MWPTGRHADHVQAADHPAQDAQRSYRDRRCTGWSARRRRRPGSPPRPRAASAPGGATSRRCGRWLRTSSTASHGAGEGRQKHQRKSQHARAPAQRDGDAGAQRAAARKLPACKGRPADCGTAPAAPRPPAKGKRRSAAPISTRGRRRRKNSVRANGSESIVRQNRCCCRPMVRARPETRRPRPESEGEHDRHRRQRVLAGSLGNQRAGFAPCLMLRSRPCVWSPMRSARTLGSS